MTRLRILHNAPIRTRVALAILSLSSVALVAMALGVYLSFQNGIRSNFDNTLRARAASNLTLVDASNTGLTLRLAQDPGNERANGVTLVRLYGAGGELVADGSVAASAAANESALAWRVTRTGTAALTTLDYGGGEQFRVLASPILNAGEVQGVLVTGLETTQIEEPLAILRAILFAAVPATSLGLAAGAFFIAGRALRPIAAITATANRIASGDLRERISGVNSRDEVGELATTFNHMIERVGETVERERRFTADAAHELRTPLAALETSIDVTLSQPRSVAEYQRTLTAMRGQTTRLTSLMRQLLMLSRVDAATVAATFEEFDLAAFLAAVCGAFQESHPRVELVSEGLESALPVRGNFELLTRVFGNLLENAVVHGSAEARIRLALVTRAGEALITIHDDGPGIPGEIRDAVFQRFRRGDAARSRGGAGLGLAIVDAVVRAHGGRVRVVPAPAGATVEISLPLGKHPDPVL